MVWRIHGPVNQVHKRVPSDATWQLRSLEIPAMLPA